MKVMGRLLCAVLNFIIISCDELKMGGARN
jgi:hypothetical protein